MPLPGHNTDAASVACAPTRLPQLDLLRGLAILLVLMHHCIVLETSTGRLKPVAFFFLRFGWTGVDLFFVLSGFLIGGLLFNEILTRGSVDVRRFIIRRGFKIWPAYVALVFYCMMIRAHQQHSVAESFHQFWPNLLHVQNYRLTPARHTWSLAVEEHFYLLLPLLMLALRKMFPGEREVRYLPVLAITAFVICLVLRVQSLWNSTYNFQQQLSPTHLRMDSLFFGVLIAWFYHFRPQWRSLLAPYGGLLFTAGLLLLVPMMILTREGTFFVTTFGFTFVALGYSLILIAAILTTPGVGRVGKLMNGKLASAIAYVGLYSYSIYLWHMDLMRGRLHHWTAQLFDRQNPELRYVLYMTTYLIVAIGSGILMAKLIESPALKLRDRLFPPRGKPLQELSPPRPYPSTILFPAQSRDFRQAG